MENLQTQPTYTDILRETQQEEFPLLSEVTRGVVDDPLRLMVSFVALTLRDKDLRAPILRSRLNLHRMLMIIAILRRHEEMGTAEGLFTEKLFTVSEADLRWGLAYIFYAMVQTSTIYDRLRREEREEPKRVYLSALAFLQMLPKQFTTAEAVRLGEDFGLKQNGIAKKLARLTKEFYIAKVRQGVFVKTSKTEREKWKKESTLLAA